MIPSFIKKYVLRTLMKKAVELHKAGSNVEQIAQRFWDEPKVAEGLVMLGIDDVELIKMIKDKVEEK